MHPAWTCERPRGLPTPPGRPVHHRPAKSAAVNPPFRGELTYEPTWRSAKLLLVPGAFVTQRPETRLPPAVTFTSGAELLVKLDIVRSMTREGVRHIATSEAYAETWPFGPDKPHPYGKAGNALLMATEPFLDFFRTVYRGPKADG